MTEVLLGPTLTDGPTTKVKDKTSGKTFYKKRILPEGKFNYRTKEGKDVELDLTAGELGKFVQSFKDNAYDEVPFQFGAHSNDPTIRKGTLAHVEHVPGKGLDGYFELDSEAAEYVSKYPNFGVSPRLVLGISRADGKKFEGAIQHVAGTVVPRMTGMGPWSKVELSEDGDTDDSTPVIDLSTETIAVKREVKVDMPEKKTEDGDGQVITLSADEHAFLQQMKKDYESIMGGGEKKETAPASVDLSEITQKADTALTEIAQIKAQAVRDSWASKKALLLSQGVPPAALDLADPVMTAVESQTFDLSTDEGVVKVDSKTQMLGQLELMKGMVDLNGELGHGIGGQEPDTVSEDEISAFMNDYGL